MQSSNEFSGILAIPAGGTGITHIEPRKVSVVIYSITQADGTVLELQPEAMFIPEFSPGICQFMSAIQVFTLAGWRVSPCWTDIVKKLGIFEAFKPTNLRSQDEVFNVSLADPIE